MGRPSAPQNLTIESKNRELAVRWKCPQPGDGDITYTVSWRSHQGSQGSMQTSLTHAKLSNLTNGVLYRIRVVATTKEGSSSGVESHGTPKAPSIKQKLSAFRQRAKKTKPKTSGGGGVSGKEHPLLEFARLNREQDALEDDIELEDGPDSEEERVFAHGRFVKISAPPPPRPSPPRKRPSSVLPKKDEGRVFDHGKLVKAPPPPPPVRKMPSSVIPKHDEGRVFDHGRPVVNPMSDSYQIKRAEETLNRIRRAWPRRGFGSSMVDGWFQWVSSAKRVRDVKWAIEVNRLDAFLKMAVERRAPPQNQGMPMTREEIEIERRIAREQRRRA